MRVYRLSSEVSDEGVGKSETLLIIYLLRFVCNKFLTLIKEFFLAFRWLADCLYISYTNLKLFVVHNPPAILFLINATLFTIILSFVTCSITVSKHIKSFQEWTTMLETFSQLELCIMPLTPNTTFGNIYLPHPTHQPSSVHFKTHTLPLKLSINPTSDFPPNNLTRFLLTTTMYGKYMGLKGIDSQTIINITLVFERSLNHSCNPNGNAMQKNCYDDGVVACVSFTAPTGVIPENNYLKQCSKNLKSLSKEQSSVYSAGLNWQLADVNALYYCRSRTILKATFHDSLKLSKPSSVEVKPETRAHLINTVVFFIIIIISCLVVVMAFSCNSVSRPYRLSERSSDEF